MVPSTGLARAATVVESAIGFGFLALVIGYLPVIYQAFSRREASISLLDARAGSPPSIGMLLLRHGQPEHISAQRQFLRDWELWSAETLESYLSFPALVYFRSQHDRQSWLAALTVVLDTSALMMAGMDGRVAHQARLTFSMARRVVVELSQVLGTTPQPLEHDRLPQTEFARLRSSLHAAEVPLAEGPAVEQRLATLRATYEPYAMALAELLIFPLPRWNDLGEAEDWQASIRRDLARNRVRASDDGLRRR